MVEEDEYSIKVLENGLLGLILSSESLSILLQMFPSFRLIEKKIRMNLNAKIEECYGDQSKNLDHGIMQYTIALLINNDLLPIWSIVPKSQFYRIYLLFAKSNHSLFPSVIFRL